MNLLASGALAVVALAFAACGGGGSSSGLTTPATTSNAGSQTPSLSVTVTKDAPATTSSSVRAPAYIPANVQSVTMSVYTGTLATPAANAAFVPPSGVTPFSTVCQNFPTGATSLTLTTTAPVGADTIVITSYTVPCSGSLVASNMASQYSGSGTVTASGGTVSSIFNGGNTVTLLPAAAASGVVLLAVTSGSGTAAATASPSPVAFKTVSETRTVAVSEANYAGTFTAMSSNTSVATVTGTGSNFTVTAVGGGSANIVFADTNGNATALSVGLTIGTLQVAWVNNGPTVPLPLPSPQLVSSNGPSATPPTASLAAGQSVAFSATQTTNSTGYTAALTGTGCSATLATVSATAGTYTVSTTSTSAPSTCSLAITGIGGQTVTTPITVLTDGSITLLWTAPNVTIQTSPPYQGNLGPAILIGSGTPYADTLYASEPNYIGSFTATVTCPSGSSGVQVSASGGTAGATATSTTGAFAITGTATAVSPPGNPCTIGVTDSNGQAAASPMAVTFTTGTGIVQ